MPPLSSAKSAFPAVAGYVRGSLLDTALYCLPCLVPRLFLLPSRRPVTQARTHGGKHTWYRLTTPQGCEGGIPLPYLEKLGAQYKAFLEEMRFVIPIPLKSKYT